MCHSFFLLPQQENRHILPAMTNGLSEHSRLFYAEAQGCNSHAYFSGGSASWSELFFTRHYADMGQLHCPLEPQAPHCDLCVQSPEAHADCLGCAPSCHTAHAGSDNAESVGSLIYTLYSFLSWSSLPTPLPVLVHRLPSLPLSSPWGLPGVGRCMQRGSGSPVLHAGSTDTYIHSGRGANALREHTGTGGARRDAGWPGCKA